MDSSEANLPNPPVKQKISAKTVEEPWEPRKVLINPRSSASRRGACAVHDICIFVTLELPSSQHRWFFLVFRGENSLFLGILCFSCRRLLCYGHTWSLVLVLAFSKHCDLNPHIFSPSRDNHKNNAGSKCRAWTLRTIKVLSDFLGEG